MPDDPRPPAPFTLTAPPAAALPPPADEGALLRRARALAGRTVRDVAGELSRRVPRDLRRRKGWLGRLVEDVLGAAGGSEGAPDFPGLGVELKTLPIDAQGRPLEATWVTQAEGEGDTWETSRVRAKLARVLWVPIARPPRPPVPTGGPRPLSPSPADFRFAAPMLWSPSPEQEAVLRADWGELMELLRVGAFDALDARVGMWLQLRPKGASARDTIWALRDDGQWVRTNARGFYLRATFTRALLQRHFALPTGEGV